jgi:hypothetical protein
MKEIVFVIKETPEGSYTACALGYSIFTEVDIWEDLNETLQEALLCHFEENNNVPPQN